MQNTKVFLLVLVFLTLYSQAQKGGVQKKSTLIAIKSAESLSYDESKNNARVLKGNVVCEHEGALLYCDTAYIYEKENRMVASGHILITKGDSLRVTGEKLIYEGKTKTASLLNNVRCIDKDMVLTTSSLIFDVGQSVVSYYTGGTIVNKKNTLTSKNGHYYSNTREAAFHYDVLLSNPDYKMNSDTLRYKLSSKTSYFLGPSIIYSKTDYIYCENGWYDTEKEKAQFSRNALLVTSQQKLRGDSLTYDRISKTGRAFRNVSLTDTSQKSVLYGNYAEYHENKREAFVTGNAEYARLLEKDSLFLAADSFYPTDLDSVNNRLLAFRHVKIFNNKVQGRCDSAAFNSGDSLMTLFYSPILWGERSQATARKISFELGQKSLKSFILDGQAFLMQQVDSNNNDKFNQLSGKSIQGVLVQDSIRKVTVNGNVEILYFPKNKNRVMGLNNTNCKEAVLWFKHNDIDRVALRPKTMGNLKPLKNVDPGNIRLEGFSWQYAGRPKSRKELHDKTKSQK